MSIKNLIDKLSSNWIPKIICVVLAMSLYIFHRVSLLEKKSLSIPLSVESDGLMMPMTKLPAYVKVSIRAERNVISSIGSDDITAVLKLNRYTEKGLYKIPIDINFDSSLIGIDPLEFSVNPEYVSLELDEKAVKYIPVKPAVSGEPENGYFIKSITINPSSVKVVGTSTMLEKINGIYSSRLNVKGSATTFTVPIKIDNINSLISVYPEGEFKATVEIAPKPFEKVFDSVLPSADKLNDRFYVSSEIPSVSIKVSSTMPVLERFTLKPSNVVLDFSTITETGSYEIPVKLLFPDSITVLECMPDKISITVSEKVKNTEDENIKENFEAAE